MRQFFSPYPFLAQPRHFDPLDDGTRRNKRVCPRPRYTCAPCTRSWTTYDGELVRYLCVALSLADKFRRGRQRPYDDNFIRALRPGPRVMNHRAPDRIYDPPPHPRARGTLCARVHTLGPVHARFQTHHPAEIARNGLEHAKMLLPCANSNEKYLLGSAGHCSSVFLGIGKRHPAAEH